MSMHNVRRKTHMNRQNVTACLLRQICIVPLCIASMMSSHHVSCIFSFSFFPLEFVHIVFSTPYILERIGTAWEKTSYNIAYFQINILFVCVNRFESICHLLSLECVHRSAHYVTHFAATHSLNLNHTLLLTFSIHKRETKSTKREQDVATCTNETCFCVGARTLRSYSAALVACTHYIVFDFISTELMLIEYVYTIQLAFACIFPNIVKFVSIFRPHVWQRMLQPLFFRIVFYSVDMFMPVWVCLNQCFALLLLFSSLWNSLRIILLIVIAHIFSNRF